MFRRSSLGRLALWAGGLWPLGCVQAPISDAPCPCAAPDRCCATLSICLPPDTACPAAGASTLTVVDHTPAELPQRGGLLTLTLDRAITAPVVRIGGGPCPIEQVDGATVACRVDANQTASADQIVHVRGETDAGSVLGWTTVRQAAAPFVSIADPLAPGGHSVTVLRLDGEGPDVIFTRGSTELGAGLGSHWAWDGPWRWRDVSAGGLVDALPPLVSIIPMHLDADDTRDLLISWGRGHPQNFQLLRALDGASGFRTAQATDVPALDPADEVRVLPITWGRENAILGVRGGTSATTRSVFLVVDRVERDPAPFSPSPDWEAEQIYDLTLVDANGDGRADVLGCGENPYLLRRTADGFVDDSTLLPPIFLYCRTMTTGDLDLDGHLDVIVGGPARASRPGSNFQGLRILRGTGDGFELVPSLAPPTDCPAPIWVGSALPLGGGAPAVLDADLDGDLDILVINPSKACPQAPVLYRNTLIPDGALGFAPEALPMGWRHVSISAVVVDDLDGDGDADVVFNGWSSPGRAGIWRNTAVETGATGRVLAVHVRDRDRPVYGAIITARLETGARPVAISGHSAMNITDGPARLPLGDYSGVVELEVRWPDGHVETRTVAPDERVIDVARRP